MAISFFAASTGPSGYDDGGYFSLPRPDDMLEGDRLFAILAQPTTDLNDFDADDSDDWTRIGIYDAGASGSVIVYTKLAAEGESDVEGSSGGWFSEPEQEPYDFRQDDDAANGVAHILVFREDDPDKTAALQVDPVFTHSTTNQGTHTAPSIDLPADATLITTWISLYNGASESYIVPTGMTECTDDGGPGNNMGMATASEYVSTAGFTGDRTADFSGNAGYIGISWSIRPDQSVRTGSATFGIALDNTSDGHADKYTEIRQSQEAWVLLDTAVDEQGFKSHTTAAAAALALDTGTGLDGAKAVQGALAAVIQLGVYAQGRNPAPRPTFVRTRQLPPEPLPRTGMRFLVQSAVTREFLSWDLPLHDAQIEKTLSGPSVISGTLAPEIKVDVTAGKDKILEPWGSLIHAEEDGEIRASGILLPSTYSANQWDIDAEGFSTYPHGIPYDDIFTATYIDPIDVVREIWRYVQSFPNSQLGVRVDPDAASDVLLGDEREPSTTKQVTDPETGKQKEVEVQGELIPYKLAWWASVDCGSELDELARTTPFDYLEYPTWDRTREDILTYINIGYPRLGRTRDDLRFVQGENIMDTVIVGEDEQWFANHVIGLGAGEGRERLRTHSSGAFDGPLPRLRRVLTYTNKKFTSQAQLKARTDRELHIHLAVHGIESIVIDGAHPNAQYGAFDVGDDILVQADVPWVGEVAIKHRIISHTLDRTTGLVQLKLARSDAFRYGKAQPTQQDG